MGPETGFTSDVRGTIYIWVRIPYPLVTMFDGFLANVRRYYGVMLPSLLLVMGGVGFCVLNCILGGQALASIANISWT